MLGLLGWRRKRKAQAAGRSSARLGCRCDCRWTQDSQASKDAVATTVGVIVFWPTLFLIGGDRPAPPGPPR